MSCRLCEVPPASPFLRPGDRRCAFDETGIFRMADNDGCATMEKLRGIALFSVTAAAGDLFIRLAPIAHADRFIIFLWLDQSHHVDQAFEVRAGDGFSLTPLSLAFAEEVIAAKEGRDRKRHMEVLR